MNEHTLTTSLGIPDTMQFDTVAGGTNIILAFEIPVSKASETENHTSTIWTRWDRIEDNISTTKDDRNPWSY